MTIVWSYGGGTQSARIAVAILRGELPKPDYAVIADTGREVQSTWDYLAEFVQPALEGIGVTVHIAPHSLATVDLYSHQGLLLIPAFTRQSGQIGKYQAYCSGEWKRAVVMRWCRLQGIEECENWIGISIDELERMRTSNAKWFRHAYPLIDMRLSRAQCIAQVEAFGWPTPPKSRCWMCPHMSERSWQELKRAAPADFAKAVALDESIRTVDKDFFVHRLGLPLGEAVELSGQQTEMFEGCDSGFCWT